MRRVELLSSEKLVLIQYKVWVQDEIGRSRDWGSYDLGITGLEVLSKILKLGSSYQLTLFDYAGVELIIAQAFDTARGCK